jgi:hypothetical protein
MSQKSPHTSKLASQLSDSFSEIYAEHSAVLIGMAFDLGVMLGRRTHATALGKKVRKGVSKVADQMVTLAPDSMANLVPDLHPAKGRRTSSRRKNSGKKKAKH